MSTASKLKKLLNVGMRPLQLQVPRVVPRLSVRGHEWISPSATYAPWTLDEPFRRVHELVRDSTLVDVYRCYELWSLVEQAAKLDRGDLLEVGVWRGGTGALIAKQAERCGLQDEVYLCDTFSGVVKAGSQDTAYAGGEHADTTRASVERLLQTVGVANATILEGTFPEAAPSALENEVFRFCHIDVDVYQSAVDILDWVWDRLVVGGMVVYDDYGFSTCSGITAHVEEQRYLDDRLVFHNLNGHAVIIKR